MKTSMTSRLIAIAAVVLAAGTTGRVPLSAFAQAPAPTPTAPAGLSSATIKALQEALNKQGIAVKTDGVLDAATREAVKKYQAQHHLPVTGEPDKATLDKLGVAAQPGAMAPAGPAPAGAGMMMPGQGGMMGQGKGGMMPPRHGMTGPGSGAMPAPGMPKQ